VTCNVGFTLEELFHGATKKLKITRKRYNQQTGQTVEEPEVKEVTVKPGFKAGTKVTFEGAGDEGPNMPPGDVIFVVKEKPHPLFKREGDDLILHLPISMTDALAGFSGQVPGIDGRTVHFSRLGQVTQPQTRQVIPGEGMPRRQNGAVVGRGDLIIIFDVAFPTNTLPREACKRLFEK